MGSEVPPASVEKRAILPKCEEKWIIIMGINRAILQVSQRTLLRLAFRADQLRQVGPGGGLQLVFVAYLASLSVARSPVGIASRGK